MSELLAIFVIISQYVVFVILIYPNVSLCFPIHIYNIYMCIPQYFSRCPYISHFFLNILYPYINHHFRSDTRSRRRKSTRFQRRKPTRSRRLFTYIDNMHNINNKNKINRILNIDNTKTLTTTTRSSTFTSTSTPK